MENHVTITYALKKDIPFVSYRRPNTRENITMFFSQEGIHKTDSLRNVPFETGFLFVPFEVTTYTPIYYLKPALITSNTSIDKTILDKLIPKHQHSSGQRPHISSKKEYFSQFQKMQKALITGEADKLVLSRMLKGKGDFMLHLPEILETLHKTYPTAFTYLLHLPGQGTWMGASPEIFADVTPQHISTVALAGTQPLNGEPAEALAWISKEKEEQAFVSRFIEDVLHHFQITDYDVQGPYPFKAGNVVHLKSRYQFSKRLLKSPCGDFLEALHPTPAVCGYPKEKAFQLIKKIEKHNREYYSGFLGPVDVDGNTSLFVNLRCMKIIKKGAALYVGGGIMKASDPEKEWKETELKAATLLNVLKNFESHAIR